MVKRGDIWWVELPEPKMSEPRYRRPVLIIQSNDFTVSNINTVIVVAITSKLKLANAPGNLYLSKEKSGLPKDSVVNVSQILTLDKVFLTEQIGLVNNVTMMQVEEGVKLVLSI